MADPDSLVYKTLDKMGSVCPWRALSLTEDEASVVGDRVSSWDEADDVGIADLYKVAAENYDPAAVLVGVWIMSMQMLPIVYTADALERLMPVACLAGQLGLSMPALQQQSTEPPQPEAD